MKSNLVVQSVTCQNFISPSGSQSGVHGPPPHTHPHTPRLPQATLLKLLYLLMSLYSYLSGPWS